MEHFQGQLDAFAHRLDRLVVRAGHLQRALQGVDHRQEVAGELLQGELVRLLHVLLGATANVLQFGGRAQVVILRRGELFFQLQHAGVQILGGSDFRLFAVLRVQGLLLVRHTSLLRKISLEKQCEPSGSWLCGLYGDRIRRFKGRRKIARWKKYCINNQKNPWSRRPCWFICPCTTTPSSSTSISNSPPA
ncbi:hypothetical protein D3C81_1658170 [compost metagenome]